MIQVPTGPENEEGELSWEKTNGCRGRTSIKKRRGSGPESGAEGEKGGCLSFVTVWNLHGNNSEESTDPGNSLPSYQHRPISTAANTNFVPPSPLLMPFPGGIRTLCSLLGH